MVKGDKDINDHIRNQKGLNKKQMDLLKTKSEQTWFRQYVRGSKEHLIKLTKTIKKQIKANKGSYYKTSRNPKEDKRGEFKKPRVKKGSTRKEVKQEIKKQKLTRIEKELVRQHKFALQSKTYSKYEVHEGINSKRSIAYRQKKNITN